jgi:DNA-binding transcriptional ArsR family regulator
MERVLPSVTFTREIGQEQVVLTPSVVVKPGFAMSDYGSTFVIAYPITADGELAAKAGSITTESKVPPDQLVRLAKAMGDELRLRALRELRDGPMSATELARRVGVPRTSIHHHLGLLISAGLVRLAADDARFGDIELREEGVTELTELAQAWLLEAPKGR